MTRYGAMKVKEINLPADLVDHDLLGVLPLENLLGASRRPDARQGGEDQAGGTSGCSGGDNASNLKAFISP